MYKKEKGSIKTFKSPTLLWTLLNLSENPERPSNFVFEDGGTGYFVYFLKEQTPTVCTEEKKALSGDLVFLVVCKGRRGGILTDDTEMTNQKSRLIEDETSTLETLKGLLI